MVVKDSTSKQFAIKSVDHVDAYLLSISLNPLFHSKMFSQRKQHKLLRQPFCFYLT